MEAVVLKITLADIKPHIARLRKELDSSKAGVLGDQQAESLGISLNKEGAIRRVWKVGNQADVYLYKAFLDFFTDAANVNDNGDNPMSYVVNPKVGDATNRKIVAPGTYRQAFTIVRPMAQDEYLLVQELRLGWITTLNSSGAVDYSEARVESVERFNGDSGDNPIRDFVTVVWKGVDPQSASSIVAFLKGLAADGWYPVVNGNSIGSHRRLYVRSEEESDGSVSIRLLLANPRLKYTTYSDWNTERQGKLIYHFGVPSDLVQAVVDSEVGEDAETPAVGATARISGPDSRGLHDITIQINNPDQDAVDKYKSMQSCSEDAYTIMYIGLSLADANAVTLPPTGYTETAGVIWTMRKQSRGDGYWDVVLENRVTIKQELAKYTAEASTGRTVSRRAVLGYTLQADEPSEASDIGKVVRVEKRLNKDCSKDAYVETIESNELDGAETRGTILGTVSESVFTENDKTPPDYVAPVVAGQVKIVSKRQKDDGTYDVTQRTDHAIETETEEIVKTVKYESLGTGARNEVTAGNAKPTSTEPVQGERVVFRTGQNEDGTWNTEERIEESPILESEEKQITVKTERTGVGYRNLRGDKPTPTTPGVGQRVIFRTSENEDGTWDKNEIVEEAIEGLGAGGGTETQCGSLGADVAYRNITLAEKTAYHTAAVAAIPDASRMVWNERENEDGTWDYAYRYETAPALESTSETIRKYGGVTEEIKRNIPDADKMATPDFEIGVTKTLRHDKNADCSWDEAYRVEVAPQLTSTQETIRADVEVEVTRQQNAQAAATAPTVGANDAYTLVNDENPDGSWNTSVQVERPQAQRAVGSVPNENGNTKVTVFRNYTEAQMQALFATASIAKRNSISASPNQYGLYDGSLTESPIEMPRGSGGATKWADYSYALTVEGSTYNVSVIFTTSNTEAQSHVQGSDDLTADIPRAVGEVPGISYIGRKSYKAVKITIT